MSTAKHRLADWAQAAYELLLSQLAARDLTLTVEALAALATQPDDAFRKTVTDLLDSYHELVQELPASSPLTRTGFYHCFHTLHFLLIYIAFLPPLPETQILFHRSFLKLRASLGAQYTTLDLLTPLYLLLFETEVCTAGDLFKLFILPKVKGAETGCLPASAWKKLSLPAEEELDRAQLVEQWNLLFALWTTVGCIAKSHRFVVLAGLVRMRLVNELMNLGKHVPRAVLETEIANAIEGGEISMSQATVDECLGADWFQGKNALVDLLRAAMQSDLPPQRLSWDRGVTNDFRRNLAQAYTSYLDSAAELKRRVRQTFSAEPAKLMQPTLLDTLESHRQAALPLGVLGILLQGKMNGELQWLRKLKGSKLR